MEEYNEYGEIIPRAPKRKIDDHRIHETKDYFDSECYLCQKAMENHVKTYWEEDI